MKLETRIHECLAEGRPAFGAFATLSSPSAIELLVGYCRLDWMGIDLQHSSLSPFDSAHLLRALQSADPAVTAFARLPGQEKFWIEQSLDTGYMGLIVPQVESADQARALVKASYYPPRGERSYAGSVRASLYDDYFANFNDRLVLLPQIESKAGLENCEAIIQEPGISGALLGPGDLSMSCGWPMTNQWSHPPFRDAVKRVAAVCTEAGKIPATLMGGEDQIRQAREAGYQMLGIGGDSVFIRTDMARQIKELIESTT